MRICACDCCTLACADALGGAEPVAVVDGHQLLRRQFLVAFQFIARTLQFGLASRQRGAGGGNLCAVLRL